MLRHQLRNNYFSHLTSNQIYFGSLSSCSGLACCLSSRLRLLLRLLLFLGLDWLLTEKNLTCLVSVSIRAVRKDKTLPLSIRLELLDDPFAEDNGWLSLRLLLVQQVRGNTGKVFWLEEEGGREALDTDV